MSKTWYGHHIENIKGDDYVLFNDYVELEKKIDKSIAILREVYKVLPSPFNQLRIDIKKTLDEIENGSDTK